MALKSCNYIFQVASYDQYFPKSFGFLTVSDPSNPSGGTDKGSPLPSSNLIMFCDFASTIPRG